MTIAGNTYKMAGVEAYSKFVDGRHELVSLRAVFCRVNETPRSGASLAMFKEMLDPNYVAPEVYHLSADEVLHASLSLQEGLVISHFKNATGKPAAVARLAADLGPEKMRAALAAMANLSADKLPRFEGMHFVATEKLTAPKI